MLALATGHAALAELDLESLVPEYLPEAPVADSGVLLPDYSLDSGGLLDLFPSLSFNAALPSGHTSAVGTTTGQFEVSPTGAATYTVPISVPPGTAGMAPKLALRYSSQGQNGLLGVGWSLSGLSNITRCPATLAQDGYIHGVDSSSADRLCLDGQRLMPVMGGYGGSGTEYRTEIESFTRVVAVGAINGSTTYFTAQTKSGLRYTFGGATGKFPVPGKAQIFLWAVDKIEDTAGNYIELIYEQDTGTGEHYLARIEYTRHNSVFIAAVNQVLFEYDQTRPDASRRYVPGGSSPILANRRLIKISTRAAAVSGGLMNAREYHFDYQTGGATNRSRLSAITECGYDALNQPACLPPTTFVWQEKAAGYTSYTSGSWFRPASFSDANDGADKPQSEVIDVNGDGLTDYVQAYQQNGVNYLNTWLNTGSGWASSPDVSWRPPTYLYRGTDTWGTFADLNADGLPDFVQAAFDNGAYYLNTWINTGSGWTLDNTWRLPSALYHTPKPNGFLTDLNGDGLPDLVFSRDNFGNVAYLNNYANQTSCSGVSCHWVQSSSYTSPIYLHWGGGERRADLVDVTGDGLPDIVSARKNDTFNTWVNTGTGWEPSARAALRPPRWLVGGSKSRGQIIDVNGDGLADLVFNDENEASPRETWLNTGDFNSATAGAAWRRDTTYDLPFRMWAWGGDREGILADVNGDGLPDFVYSADEGVAPATYLNGGAGSAGCGSAACRWRLNSGYTTPELLFNNSGSTRGTVADLNADGISDLLFAAVGRPNQTAIARGPVPDLVAVIQNGLGAQVQVVYGTLTDKLSYSKGAASAYPDQTVISPMTVVRQHKASNGVTGLNTVTYGYTRLVSSLHGRGLYGFEQVTTLDSASGNRETSAYSLSFPYVGMLTSSVSRSSSGALLSATSNTLSSQTANCGAGGRVFAFVDVSVSVSYEITPYNFAVKNQRTDTDYDGCGNATRVAVSTNPGSTPSTGGHVTTTVSTYTNNPASWQLGRLTRSTVTNSQPGGSATRVSAFTYDANTGLLTSEVIEPDNAYMLKQTTRYTYDGFGNKTSVTVEGKDPDSSLLSRTTTTVYDAVGRFALRTSNALGHTETYTHDERHGGRQTLTGPNNLTTRWTYDAFGRVTREERPGPASTDTVYRGCDAACPAGAGGVMVIHSTDSSGAQARKVLDMLERPVSETKLGFNGGWVHQRTAYDIQGRVQAVSRPHYAGSSAHWTVNSYDALDRLTQQNAPMDENTSSGRLTRFVYNGLTTQQYDPNNHLTTKLVDVLGRTSRVTDDLGGAVNFAYDPFGNLIQTTDPAGNVVTMSYDIRGRKTAMTDPDMGTWSYVYDGYGQLRQQKNANGQTATMYYDPLGRMRQRSEAEGTTTWTYDSQWKGALSLVVAPQGYQQAYTYDALGRPIRVRTKMDGTDYYVDTGFDANSRPETLTYPGGFVIRNVYNAYGYHSEVRRASDSALLWKLDSLDPDDSVAGETLGNGLSTATYRDQARGHIVSIMTGLGGGSSIQNLAYSWDLDGNLLTRSDHNQGGLTESFSYDRLHRLSRSTRNGVSNLTMSYDALGNITRRVDLGHDGTYNHTVNYVYDADKPHQLMATSGDRPALFLYDANGNQTSASGRSVAYTSYDLPRDIQQIVPVDINAQYTYIGTLLEGLLAAGQVAYNRSQFWYDPQRARYKQVLSRVGGPPQSETTYYVGNLYEKVQQGSAVTHRNYVRAYGRVVAIHHRYGSGGEQTLYPHRDHLGSVHVVTRDDRSVVERLSYDAFGKRRNSNWMNDTQGNQLYDVVHATNRGYTGHEHLDAVGLIHMNGRVYDPIYGRMLSADPFVQFPESSQGFNRYSYVNNNPLSYTDPSGFFLETLAAIKAFVDAYALEIAISSIVIGKATDNAALTQIGFALLPGGQGYGAAFAKGFAGGLISSNGDIRQAAIGGVTAAAFFQVGETFGHGVPTDLGSRIGKIVAHGVVGGVSTELSGGSFKEGFLSSGFAESFAGPIDSIGGGDPGAAPLRIAAAAIVGGTAAKLGGGKFANGAYTTAFLQTTAEAADYYERTTGFAADPTPGDQYYVDEKGVCCEYPIQKGGRTPGPTYDVIGFNEQLTGNFRADFGKQGGALAKYFLRWVPGVPATSHLHDTWLNPLTANGTAISPLLNYGTMLPAYAISSAAIIGNATRGWQNNPMVWHAITQRYGDDD